MFQIALYQPEIPPNTGNIIRLSANTGCQLHLIHPLGFELDDTRLKRAGLDYHEYASVIEHKDFASFMAAVSPARVFGLSTRGKNYVHDVQFEKGDVFLFGPETRGLPEEIRQQLGENLLRIPMLPTNRSLNLSNAATLVVYEAWRQLGFAGAE